MFANQQIGQYLMIRNTKYQLHQNIKASESNRVLALELGTMHSGADKYKLAFLKFANR